MKHLKSLLHIALISLVLVGTAASLAACSKDARTLLQEVSNELNETCPFQCDPQVVLTHTSVDQHYFVYTYKASEEYVALVKTQEGKDYILYGFYALASCSSDIRYILGLCNEAGLGIEYRYSDNCGNSATVVIEIEDICNIL